jgi:hypothetical protein
MLLKVADVAARLNISHRQARRIVGTLIPVVATGKSARGDRVEEADVEEFKRRRKRTREAGPCRFGRRGAGIASASCAGAEPLEELLTRMSRQGS